MNSIWIRNIALALIVILLLLTMEKLYQQKSPRELAREKLEDFYSGKGPNPTPPATREARL